MFPPPPKKQICASLQQQQQQQQFKLQTGTSKSNSIHSQSNESLNKIVNKTSSSGAHSSPRNFKSMTISIEPTAKSPSPENASPNSVHKSAPTRNDRLKSESAKEELTVEKVRAESPESTSKSKTVPHYESIISPSEVSSSSDNEDCKENDSNNRKSWSISPSSSSLSPSSASHLTLPTRCDYVNVIVSCKADNDTAVPSTEDDQYVVRKKSKRKSTASVSTLPADTLPDDDDSDTDLVTLSIKRIFTDSYLLDAWEKLQFIDLFLYSPDKSDSEPHLENFIPGHRMLLSAYSDYIRTFVDSYPEPVKFVEQLQSFLKDVITHNKTPYALKASSKGHQDAKQLSLKALGMSSIPVIVFSVPLDDLHDLVKLMYRGKVKVNRCRINSLQKSASELKMSSIKIVEMNKQLIIDSSCSSTDSEKHLTEESSDNFSSNLSSAKEVPVTANNTQNGNIYKNNHFSKLTLQHSCDLESIISTSQSSNNSLPGQDGSNKPEVATDAQTLLTPPVIQEDEKTETLTSNKMIKEEREEGAETNTPSDPVKQLHKHPAKRSFAAFLREHGTPPPPLAIPKRVQPNQVEDEITDSILQNATFEKQKPQVSRSSHGSEHLSATIAEQQQQQHKHNFSDVPPQALLQLGKNAFPMFSRSQSLNEMEHQHQLAQQRQQRHQFHQQTLQVQAEAFRAAMQTAPSTPSATAEAQSPLISALKRKETPPMPPTPSSSGYSSSASSSMLSPFQGFSSHGLLPASLLTPPIDSPSIIESQLKSLLPFSQNAKPFLFPSLPTPLPTPALSSPFLYSTKNPFDTGPPAFPTSFAFPKTSTAGIGGSGGGGQPGQLFQRQFSAPANLQSSLFTHQPHDLSSLIYDAQNALNINANAAVNSELTKSGRRGRKPISQTFVPSAPNSEPNSPDIGLMMSDLGLFSGPGSALSGSLSERSDSPEAEAKFGDSHQCGANGWKITPGSGANCRKRCQNLYHAAKYRDRRRQRMEQLYGEKDALEKAQGGHLAKINSLKCQIVNLINQRTVRQSASGPKSYHCPVCSSVFLSTDAIRGHLFSVHYQEMANRQSPSGIGASAATASGLLGTAKAPSFAAIVQNTDPSADIAQQICSLTKDWLMRSQVVANLEQLQNATLQQQQQQQQRQQQQPQEQQQQEDQIAKSMPGLTIESPTPAHFERSLTTGAPLNVLSMVPYN